MNNLVELLARAAPHVTPRSNVIHYAGQLQRTLEQIRKRVDREAVKAAMLKAKADTMRAEAEEDYREALTAASQRRAARMREADRVEGCPELAALKDQRDALRTAIHALKEAAGDEQEIDWNRLLTEHVAAGGELPTGWTKDERE